MKRSSDSCFVHISCLVLVFLVLGASSKDCGDPECKSVIASGRVALNYKGGGGQKVNLVQAETVEILARNIGKERMYWVRKANGQEGLAAKHFIHESSILIKSSDLLKLPEDAPKGNVNDIKRTVIVDTVPVDQTVVEGTVLASDVASENLTPPTVTATEAPIIVQPTPTLEVIPSGQATDTVPLNSNTQTKEAPEEDGEDDEDEDEADEEDDEEEENEVIDTNGEEGPESKTNNHQNQSSSEPVEVEDKGTDKVLDDINDKQAEDTGSPEPPVQDEAPDSPDNVSAGEKITFNREKTEPEEKLETFNTNDGQQQEPGDIRNSGIFDILENIDTSTELNSSNVSDQEQMVEENPYIQTNDRYNAVNSTIDAGTGDNLMESNEITTTSTPTVATDPANLSTDQSQIVTDASEPVRTESSLIVENTSEPVQETVTEATLDSSPDLFQEVPAAVSVSEPTAVADQTNATPLKSYDQPTHPNRILAGGLGNLLAHSHHHHHHHHHNHPHLYDHHGHDEPKALPAEERVQEDIQTVGDTHLHFSKQDDSKESENIAHATDPHHNEPSTEQIKSEVHTHSPPPEPIVQTHTDNVDLDGIENGYCNSLVSDCPPASASNVLPTTQQTNGVDISHHSLASQLTPPMSESAGWRNEGEIEQPKDVLQESAGANYLTAENPPLGEYVDAFIREAIKLSDLILMLAITSFTLLVFSLGHYLINKNRREKPLIYKLNMVERDLMTSYKENGLLKNELQDTKHKLTSIENNSFGSNDMVIALKAELEAAQEVKLELQDQIAGLEKELENAAEAGLELNKMVAELLNQNGSDSIALSVEELQRQLNEQQQTILTMNASLAEKSRENSDLQITIASQTSKFNERLSELERARTELSERRTALEAEVVRLQSEKHEKVEGLRKESTMEIDRLTRELKASQAKADEGRRAVAAAEAKCEALEECLKEIKSAGSGGQTTRGLIDSVELKAQIALLAKEKANLQDKLQGEIIARQLVEDHMKMVNEEISVLKRDFSKSEKDKLEAETRLEVLSTYFKEKESQLQKELSVKEAMWMQQQGETTTTVEKIRHMQDEIQQLKSQNDKLRAEIEAQTAAHKAQYTTLETRSHDAWLSARQAERRLEEARNESAALRRKLTALGDVSASSDGMMHLQNASIAQPDLGLTAPSPIRVESPNAPPPPPLMGVLPPPPFMPPFLPGPPPPFMSPFMPPPHGPGEMRPPPLGRLMSPPPPAGNRYSPNSIIDARDRYSPDRGRYSPDSRYDYSVMSTYETENDFSPPPSPSHHSRHSNYDRERDRDRVRDRDRDRERDRERDRDRDRDRDGERDRERDHRDGRASGNGGYPRGFTPTDMRTSPPLQDPRNKKFAGGFSSGSQDSLGTRKSSGKYRSNVNR